MAFTLTPVPKLKRNEMIILLTTLSWMIGAGLSIKEGIEVLIEDPNTKMSKKVLDIINSELDEGKQLSEIFRDHENIFGVGRWRQIDAAERTGKVAECLIRISEQIKSDGNLLGKIRGAVAYPAFILVFALIAGYYMFSTIVPQIGEMMLEFDAELPAMTVMMINASNWISNNIILIVLIVGGTSVFIHWLLTHPLRVRWHRLITRIPYVGAISVNVNYSLIYILLNDMLENGAHMVEALRVAACSASNSYIRLELEDAAQEMEREGFELTEALISTNTMPSDDKLMLQVGNTTGRSLELLSDLSVRRKEAARDSVDALMQIMPSVVLIVVALAVGAMVISIYMPMITMTGQIG